MVWPSKSGSSRNGEGSGGPNPTGSSVRPASPISSTECFADDRQNGGSTRRSACATQKQVSQVLAPQRLAVRNMRARQFGLSASSRQYAATGPWRRKGLWNRLSEPLQGCRRGIRQFESCVHLVEHGAGKWRMRCPIDPGPGPRDRGDARDSEDTIRCGQPRPIECARAIGMAYT